MIALTIEDFWEEVKIGFDSWSTEVVSICGGGGGGGVDNSTSQSESATSNTLSPSPASFRCSKFEDDGSQVIEAKSSPMRGYWHNLEFLLSKTAVAAGQEQVEETIFWTLNSTLRSVFSSFVTVF